MSDIPEALGTMSKDSIYARTVEPAAGEGAALRGDGHTHEGACLNCGTELAGTYCHACGQRGHVHRTISAFFHDLLHGVLHFEGKIWRTLPMLVWHPGRLTREYVEGRRARYVSPIALFLFTVFLTFALFSLLGGGVNVDAPSITPATREQMTENIKEIDRQMIEVARLRDNAAAINQPTEGFDRDLVDLQASRSLIETLQKTEAVATGEVDVHSNVLEDGSALLKSIEHAISKAKSNPKLMIYKLQTNSYKLSWLLIPLSLPFMWMMFPFSRRFRMYDHTVFVTYSITFMTMLIAVASTLAYAGWGVISAPLTIVAPLHIYRQLREAYAISRMGALLRTFSLLICAGMVLMLFIAIMAGMVLSS